jgi:hypothetical protein
MTLDIIRTRTTWNDAAGSINNNYAKIADAIAQLKANGGGGGGGADIDLTDYATKVWVEAKGYITASTLTPYALKTDIPSLVGYATKDFVDNKLVDYAPLTSIQGFENRIGGLEGAVPKLNERVTTVESKVSTLNETVSTGENNLLDRVNVIEEEYATKTYVDNAIDGIDLSPYLKTEDAEDTYATKDYVTTKLASYATTDSVTAIQNTLTGQIGAVDARVDSNDEQIAILNETTSGHTTSIGTLTQRVDSVEQLAATKLDSSYFTLANIKSTLGISDWALAATKPSYTATEVGALSLDGTSKMQQSKNIEWSNTEGYEDIDVFSNGLRLLGYNTSKGNYGGGIHIGTRYGWQLMTKWGENPLYYRSYDINSQIWRDWKQLAFITDNVASATKLQTPRSLWGQSFDGTDKVSGDINNAAGGIYIHETNEINSFNGKLYLNHRGSGLTGYGSTNDIVMVANGGKVGIGNSSPTERLDVSGNIKASGNINATSITINGVTITASNGYITVNGNVFATGAITAKAVG